MAIQAVNTGVFCTVTVHAAAHGDVCFAKQLVALTDLSVAFRAGIAGLEMGSVAKVRRRWNLMVNTVPAHRAIVFRRGGEFLISGLSALHTRVALHTDACSGDTH